MIKDLQDAIKHAREKAEELRERAYSDFDSWTDRGKALATKCLECAAEHDQLADLLTELAERREADRWIPVSERLPEYSGLYLVSIYELVTVANFTGTEFTDRSIPNAIREVSAWKPLPKSYESEDK